MKKMLMLQVKDSIFNVMETMFYFTVEEKKQNVSDLFSLFDRNSLKACAIKFSGTFSGTIFLLIPLNVLTAMTHNFLGQDSDHISEAHTDGTLTEALNMIAGEALTKLDAKSYIGLGIPELIDPATISPDDTAVVFNTKKGMIASFILLDE